MTHPDPIDVAVGARVRALRELRKISQTTLGDAIGVSFQQIQKYERGTNRISVSALVRMAEALTLSPAELLMAFPNSVTGGPDADAEAFLADVRAELAYGRAKFPGNELKGLAFGEEAGEVVKAMLDEPAARVRREAVQAAASAMRLALDGDSSVDAWRARQGLDALGLARRAGRKVEAA